MSTTEQKPFLGGCKECDFRLFATEDAIQPAETFQDMKQPGAYRKEGTVFGRCPKRHRVFVMRQVKGTYSEAHKCDSRCLNARGHECTCACGGANHGRGYAAVVHKAGEIEEDDLSLRFLGEIGKHIVGGARVKTKLDVSDATLYVFEAMTAPAIIKWYAPSYVNPEYEVGQEIKFRAKVKRHEDHPRYGKSTLVTYLEEIK